MVNWHASIGKNTSHMFACLAEAHKAAEAGAAAEAGGTAAWQGEAEALEQLVLVNMDCDNCYGPGYPEAVATALVTARQALFSRPPRCGAAATSGHGSYTGRLGYWASDWLQVGGYDQEAGILGMGGQDVDMNSRLGRAARAADPNARKIPPITSGVGIYLPNSPNKEEDRGIAKIVNCAPSDVQLYKYWGTFNAHNVAAFKAKEPRGNLRNIEQNELPTRPDATLELLSRRVGAGFRELQWPGLEEWPEPQTEGQGAAAEPRPQRRARIVEDPGTGDWKLESVPVSDLPRRRTSAASSGQAVPAAASQAVQPVAEPPAAVPPAAVAAPPAASPPAGSQEASLAAAKAEDRQTKSSQGALNLTANRQPASPTSEGPNSLTAEAASSQPSS